MGKKGAFNKPARFNGKVINREIRDHSTIAQENQCEYNVENDDGDEDISAVERLTVNICLWEFGQNDPKR